MDDIVIPPGARVVVVVVTMPGCPACHEYLPRVQEIAPSYQRVVPIVYLSADDQRPAVQAWMDQYRVEAVPATLILRRRSLGGGVWKLDGAQSPEQLRALMDYAYSLGVR